MRTRPGTSSPASSSSGHESLSSSLDRVVLAPLTAADWPAAARIYEAGIAAADATFESKAPSWSEFSRDRAGCPGVLARGAGQEILGWAALSPASARPVYRGVGAVSIYVDPAHARRGVGRALLNALIEGSERAGFWTLEAGIFPENMASIALHEGCGFRLVGVRRRVGQMPDARWRDVALYERRSPTVGAD